MNMALRAFCMIVSSFSFYSVIYKLIKRQMNESNSILWFMVGFLMLIAGFFPDLITSLAAIIRVDYPPTLLFLVSIIALILISFKSSADLSKVEKQVTEMAIVVSLLKEQNGRLQKKLEEKEMFDK